MSNLTPYQPDLETKKARCAQSPGQRRIVLTKKLLVTVPDGLWHNCTRTRPRSDGQSIPAFPQNQSMKILLRSTKEDPQGSSRYRSVRVPVLIDSTNPLLLVLSFLLTSVILYAGLGGSVPKIGKKRKILFSFPYVYDTAAEQF